MVVGYFNYDGLSVEGAIAAADKRRWANRGFIEKAFDYPFNQLGVKRFVVRVEETNREAFELDKRLGFVEEGRLREASPDGNDIIILGMLRRECRWLDQKRPEGCSPRSQTSTDRLMNPEYGISSAS